MLRGCWAYDTPWALASAGDQFAADLKHQIGYLQKLIARGRPKETKADSGAHGSSQKTEWSQKANTHPAFMPTQPAKKKGGCLCFC
jgi:hypothetical protein|eukprot:COSAG02_NODE_8395_length_2586_cov_9.043828_4_plen_86_part_00